MNASESLKLLTEGNGRFSSGKTGQAGGFDESVAALSAGQAPFAAILACADSRVAPEIIFDRELGDLFVVRVAGNIATPSQIGSIEFAAMNFGTRLVVVLGHSGCGAVSATLAAVEGGEEAPSDAIGSLVGAITPAVGRGDDLDGAIKANVEHQVEQLSAGSALLSQLSETEGLEVIGACYSLSTGRVEFYGGR